MVDKIQQLLKSAFLHRTSDVINSMCLQPADNWKNLHLHLAMFAGGNGAAVGLRGVP